MKPGCANGSDERPSRKKEPSHESQRVAGTKNDQERTRLWRARLARWAAGVGLFVLFVFAGVGAVAELRFPPPDFESGYRMPTTQYPAARAQVLEWLDVLVLIGALVLSGWAVYGKRSRKWVVGLSLFSLLYFGFYREGCICAIGSVQNVALALFGNGYALPVGVGVFFAAPLLAALFMGRTFCAAVCPHGALQDLVLVRAVTVPKWLESGLSILPLIYLGAGITFAATGAAFLICRFDPFVPIFRMSGGVGMLVTGGVFLGVAMFVGRPYCRFLCPYGALLRVASTLSRWRVRITPDVCTQCRLCPPSCPYGVIDEPDTGLARPREVVSARRRVVTLLGWLPVVLMLGAGAGWLFGAAAARLHPTVALADQYREKLGPEILARLRNPARLALGRAEKQAKELLPRADDLRRRFRTGGLWFGLWCGVVVGVKLVSLGMVRRRNEYQPDRAACLACARCFASCPQERIRLGLAPEPVGVAAHADRSPVHPVPAAKSGGCGCGAGGAP